MYYGSIKDKDIANGPGVRVTLFVSGCTHHCKDCFNPETWDFHYGSLFDEAAENKLLSLLAPSFIKGLTLLGGEPMEPANQKALLPFLKRVRETYPEKSIWCFSGYTLEELTGPRFAEVKECAQLLSLIDVLVDGEFMREQKSLMLRFRGSRNQRILDLPRSLAQGKAVYLPRALGGDPPEEVTESND